MPKLTAKGDAAIWLGAIFFVLDLLSVILRILARRTKRIALAVDDYLIILAIPLEFTYISLLLWGKQLFTKLCSVFLTSFITRRHWRRRCLGHHWDHEPWALCTLQGSFPDVRQEDFYSNQWLRCNTLPTSLSIPSALSSNSQLSTFTAASLMYRSSFTAQVKSSFTYVWPGTLLRRVLRSFLVNLSRLLG